VLLGSVLALLAIRPAIRMETSVRLVRVTRGGSGISIISRRWMGRWRRSAWERVEDVVRGIEVLLGTAAP
jgi:hypothetical protein